MSCKLDPAIPVLALAAVVGLASIPIAIATIPFVIAVKLWEYRGP